MNGTRNMVSISAKTVPTFKPVVIGVHRRAGHVYFMTDGKFIKIGHSTGPTIRRQGVRSLNKNPVTLLCHFPGYVDEEHNLHRFFADLKIEGEWFKKHRRLIRFIAKLERHRGYFYERVITINDVIFNRHTKLVKAWHAEGRMLLRH